MVSSEARDLIERMLAPDPQDRITMGEIAAHPWMAGPTVEPAVLLATVDKFRGFDGTAAPPTPPPQAVPPSVAGVDGRASDSPKPAAKAVNIPPSPPPAGGGVGGGA